MKEFYKSLFDRLTAFAPSVLHKAVYNAQYENIRENDPERGYLFEMPAVFFELDTSNIKQLGAGYQMFEPLVVTAHIVMQQLDDSLGGLDQNLDIYALRDEVLLALQGFYPYQGGEMIRTSEFQDYDHQNMYVMKVMFTTTYVDLIPKDVIRGIESTPTYLITEEFQNPLE